MEFVEQIGRLAVAFGVGLLIGLERGWRTREAASGSRAAGIRTFAITGLLGGIVGTFARSADGSLAPGGAIILGVGLAVYAAVIALFAREENRAAATFSATTPIAAILTFAIGAYAALGDIRIAAAAGVAAAGILALREELHGWIEKITWPELRSGLVLLAMTFLALPIMPNEPVGPFGGFNPREVWLIAIVLAAVSFVGYVAARLFGETHGTLLTAAAGGLVSSTAVTVDNARRAAAGEGETRLLVAGVAVATAISIVRVAAIVGVLNPALLRIVAAPLLAAAIVAAGAGVGLTYLQRDEGGQQYGATYRNPFGFWSVLGFAVLLAAIMVLGRGLSDALGAAGAIGGAILAGLADVDAVTVSMSRLAPQPLSPMSASLAILAALGSNTISKIAIGAAFGRGRFAVQIGLIGLACFAAAGIALGMVFATS
jgi:uncharacterized membrane protein (DUF4010 family)